MEEQVSLKEFFALQIQNLQKDISHLTELVARDKELAVTKEGLESKALVLQFQETERRLTQLNNEAARLALMIPRSEFDLVVGSIRQEFDGLRKDYDKLKGEEIKTIQLWISNQEGKAARAQLIAIASLVVSLILGAIHFFSKK